MIYQDLWQGPWTIILWKSCNNMSETFNFMWFVRSQKVRNSRYIIHIILNLYRSLKMYPFKRYFRTHTKQYCLYSFTHQKKKEVYLKNKSRTKHIQKLTFRSICGIIHPCHGTYLNKLLIYTYIIVMGYRKGNSCSFLSIYRFVSCFFLSIYQFAYLI